MNWPGPTFTDSGGVQVMSLGVGFKKVLAMTTEGVTSDEVIAPGKQRMAHVDDDGVVFVRESDAESVLVLGARGDVDVELALHAVPGAAAAEALVGDATFGVSGDGAVALAADGPVFAAWALPGVRAPGV